MRALLSLGRENRVGARGAVAIFAGKVVGGGRPQRRELIAWDE